MKKILLIQVWIGKIPDYFWYHYETTKNIKNVDFLFYTDQKDLKIDSDKYTVKYIDKDILEEKLNSVLNSNIKILSNKKISDLKSAYGDIFYEDIKNYDFFGFYDIDTLFGDLNGWVGEHLEDNELVSFGTLNYHDRISGPLIIMRNSQKMRELYKLSLDNFIKCFSHNEVEAWDEHAFYSIVKENIKYKLIYDSINCETDNGGKNTYDCVWSGGKVFVKNKEKLLYHFYRKNHTTFNRVGNKIYAKFDKKYSEDFYWVAGFTENYSDLIYHLMSSMNKYSNRKCVLYTINFDYKVPDEFFASEQFILRRIEIPFGIKDFRGRDQNILNLKPKLMIDIINTIPNKKYVFIDTDIYLTTTSDDITKYFVNLDHYPLINSHVHDVILLSGYYDQPWTSSLHLLLKELDVQKEPVAPRRKTNVVIFDERSKWFFEKQIEIYNEHKDKDIPALFALHDEDTANAILTMNDYYKCLPLVDIEESTNLDINKFHNYSYNIVTDWVSPFVHLPSTVNDILFFHGFKNKDDFERIKNDYGNTVLDCEELVITYKDLSLIIEKNSFLTSKKNIGLVDFVIKDSESNILFIMENQNLMQYWYFFISDFKLNKGFYYLEIIKKDNNHKIFRNVFEVL